MISMISLILSMSFWGCSENEKDTSSSDDTSLPQDSGETPLELSNNGPDGDATAINSCGPTDGPAIMTVVHTLSEVCEEEHIDTDWSVVLNLYQAEIISEQTYTIGDMASASFFYEDVYIAEEGSFSLQFEGEWQEGTEFTGYYWIDGTDFPLIEGHFSGKNCAGEATCG